MKDFDTIKNLSIETYFFLKRETNNRRDEVRFRDMVVDSLKLPDSKNKLYRIGISKELADSISELKTEKEIHTFGSFLWLDWEASLKNITKETLINFFEDRPKVSPSYISEEAGFSAKYLRLILSGERPLTDSAISKLKPVLELHGWGRKKEKESET